MMAPDEALAILHRMRTDAERLLAEADPLLIGQLRALHSRIDVLLALQEDGVDADRAGAS